MQINRMTMEERSLLVHSEEDEEIVKYMLIAIEELSCRHDRQTRRTLVPPAAPTPTIAWILCPYHDARLLLLQLPSSGRQSVRRRMLFPPRFFFFFLETHVPLVMKPMMVLLVHSFDIIISQQLPFYQQPCVFVSMSLQEFSIPIK